jgi:Ribose/xylose/arabinose/galactoside ABC-type transport systems, permease components
MNRLLKSREPWLALAILAVLVLVTIRFPRFAQPGNLLTIFNDTSILMMLALGQMAVILTRSIDLSMASNMALTGMLVALANAAFPEIPVPLLIAGCVTVGGALGAFNGVLVWKLDIPPIVVTLGTLTIFRGLAFVVSGGTWVNAAQMSQDFIQLQRGSFLGLPILSWFAIVVAILVYVLMTRTPLGRAFYAIGVNPVAAVYTGINVGRTKFLAFVLSGAVSGLAGYLYVSKYVIASTESAGGYELTIIAACVIGGVSIAGGIGTVAGALLGALFLGVVNNALPVIGVSPFWQMAIAGAAILLAVVLNASTERSKGRVILKQAEGMP